MIKEYKNEEKEQEVSVVETGEVATGVFNVPYVEKPINPIINQDFISRSIDTSSKKILLDFTFGSEDYTGALKTGDIEWNPDTGLITGGSGIVINKKGIIGANAGVVTFSIDGETGSASFSGDITGATITGSTFQTSATGQRMVIESVNNTLTFYNATGTAVSQMGGGTYIGIALRIINDVNTTDGVSISSAVAGVGFRYDNGGNVNSVGLFISKDGASSTGDGIHVDSSGSGDCIYIDNNGSGRGILVDMASTTSFGLYILNTTAGTASSIDLENGNNVSMAINATCQSACIVITNSTSGGNPTGIEFNIANSTGNEYAMKFSGSEVVGSAVTGTQNKKVRVLVGSSVYYIPLYDA